MEPSASGAASASFTRRCWSRSGQAVELGAHDRHLEVVSGARSILDVDRRRIRERPLEKRANGLGLHRGHASRAGYPAGVRFLRGLLLFKLGFWAGMLASAALLKRVLPSRGDADSDEVALVAILDGVELKSRARAFRGGSMFSWLGGIAVDLREARARARRTPRRALALRRHRDPRSAGLEGRVEREGARRRGRDRRPEPEADDAPTLRLDGFTAFGGVAVGAKAADELARCAERRSTSSRCPSGSSARSRRRSAERSTRPRSSSFRGSCASPASTRRRRRTSCASRSSSSAASSARPTRSPARSSSRRRSSPCARRAATSSSSARSSPSASRRSGSSPAAADVTHGTRVYLDALVDGAQGRRRAREGRRVRVGRRPPRRARGRERNDRAAHRHPAARGRGAEALARRPARRREGPSHPAGARRRLPRPPRRGGSRAALAPRGLASAWASRSSTPRGRSAASTSSIPYTEDLRPVRDEGFAAYARRVGAPYAQAVARHFDPRQPTLTERGLGRLARRQAA